MIRWEGVGRPRLRDSDHETRFCGCVGGGLRRRIYSQPCPWRRLWAWRRLSWRLRAQSYDTPRIASTADARFSKPDSGPARSTYAAARHQRAVGAEPIWRAHVANFFSRNWEIQIKQQRKLSSNWPSPSPQGSLNAWLDRSDLDACRFQWRGEGWQPKRSPRRRPSGSLSDSGCKISFRARNGKAIGEGTATGL